MTVKLTPRLIQAVAHNRDGLYNVVYLYGKEETVTFLLDTVVVLTASAQPDKKVARIKANFLADEWYGDILHGRRPAVPECDVLILENIQAMAGREVMEEILYGVFDHFLESHRRLIFTGNGPTSRMLQLADRIRAQIDGGVALELE